MVQECMKQYTQSVPAVSISIDDDNGPAPPVVLANIVHVYIVMGDNSASVNVSTGLSCTWIGKSPSSSIVQLRLYESMSRSPTGGSHENLMPKFSAIPVKFLGGPEGAACRGMNNYKHSQYS